MSKKLLTLFLCLISIIFMNNPAMAIEKSQTIIIDNYKPELTSFINISEGSEPIYLARERKTRDSEPKEISWSWVGSIFITGLGQILLGEVIKGLLFIAGAIIGVVIIGFTFSYLSPPIATIYAFAIQIWSVFDAYAIAKKQAEGNDEEARLLTEKLAQLEKTFNKFSVENSRLNYSLATF